MGTVPEMMSWTLVPALALLFPLSEARPGDHFIVETEDAGDGGSNRVMYADGGSNKIENRANRESEPFLESDDDYDYDEYESVELDTANKALAWRVPENRGVSRPRDVQ